MIESKNKYQESETHLQGTHFTSINQNTFTIFLLGEMNVCCGSACSNIAKHQQSSCLLEELSHLNLAIHLVGSGHDGQSSSKLGENSSTFVKTTFNSTQAKRSENLKKSVTLHTSTPPCLNPSNSRIDSI